MKERGILFTPENYDKTERGVKVQTRRIVKPQPHPGISSYSFLVTGWKPAWSNFDIPSTRDDNKLLKCPFGTVGDRLYVKEAHYLYGSWWRVLAHGKVSWTFICDQREGVYYLNNPPAVIQTQRTETGWFKRSPLHMPKRAARLWLEITAVRVERVQGISEDDVQAEGVDGVDPGELFFNMMTLWESIHGPGSWDLNPWVWVISYKKVTR